MKWPGWDLMLMAKDFHLAGLSCSWLAVIHKDTSSMHAHILYCKPTLKTMETSFMDMLFHTCIGFLITAHFMALWAIFCILLLPVSDLTVQMKYQSMHSYKVQQFWHSGIINAHFHSTLHFLSPKWQLPGSNYFWFWSYCIF